MEHGRALLFFVVVMVIRSRDGTHAERKTAVPYSADSMYGRSGCRCVADSRYGRGSRCIWNTRHKSWMNLTGKCMGRCDDVTFIHIFTEIKCTLVASSSHSFGHSVWGSPLVFFPITFAWDVGSVFVESPTNKVHLYLLLRSEEITLP